MISWNSRGGVWRGGRCVREVYLEADFLCADAPAVKLCLHCHPERHDAAHQEGIIADRTMVSHSD